MAKIDPAFVTIGILLFILFILIGSSGNVVKKGEGQIVSRIGFENLCNNTGGEFLVTLKNNQEACIALESRECFIAGSPSCFCNVNATGNLRNLSDCNTLITCGSGELFFENSDGCGCLEPVEIWEETLKFSGC